MSLSGKKIIKYLLFTLLLFRIIYLLFINIDKYTPNYWNNFSSLENVYLNSQYRSEHPTGWIPDETAYSYAAGAYLKGVNPIALQSEMPPFGTYLIGLSIMLFNNQNIVIFITYILFIWGFYTLARLIALPGIAAIIITILVSFEPLISDQLKYMPLMDLFIICLHIWAIIIVTNAIKQNSNKLFIIGTALLGCAMMAKIFTVSLPLYIILIFFWIRHHPEKLLTVIWSLVVNFMIACLVYFRIYWDGKTPLDVLKIQKWIFWYHRSKINHFFTIWPLIFLNRWYVWWGEQAVISDNSWSFSWPIVFGGTILYFLRIVIHKFHDLSLTVQIILAWVIVYSCVMSIGQATARYLIPVLPYVYLLTFQLIYKQTEILIQYHKK